MSDRLNICVIIPVYNNEKTISDVIERCQKWIQNIFVINDGSTDGTKKAIEKLNVTVIHFEKNQGKGAALVKGFQIAQEKGFTHAITIDADGQHYPEDIPVFVQKIKEKPNDLILGIRQENQNMTGRSKFGRNLSNILSTIYTFQLFKDIQCGYRSYPLSVINQVKTGVKRYDFEIESAIKTAWKGLRISHVPVQVYYDEPDKRISHFRAFQDNVRQSLGFFKLGIQAIFRVPIMYLKKMISSRI